MLSGGLMVILEDPDISRNSQSGKVSTPASLRKDSLVSYVV